MTNELNTDLTQLIEFHLLAWADHRDSHYTTSDLIDGFVAWSWDVRSETLEALMIEDVEAANDAAVQIASDLDYSIRQDERADEYDLSDGEGLMHAICEWIADHADELIEALETSLDED